MSELPTQGQINDLKAGQLDEARTAWRNKREADSQLTRLAKYKTLTPGMKDDRAKWIKRLTAAQETLARILGA